MDADDSSTNSEENTQKSTQIERKKRKAEGENLETKSSTLPPGYQCKICGDFSHSIYDCPQRVPRKKLEKGISVEDKASTASNNFKSEENESVYMSGLPFSTTKESLDEFLRAEGFEPSSIKLVPFEDNSSKCRGIAFISFADCSTAKRALALTGRSLGKKTITVEPFVINKSKKVKRASEEPEKTFKKKANGKRCYRCGQLHDPASCVNPRICYRCQSTEHLSSACPLRKAKE